MSSQRFLVTGGAGFIGSNFVTLAAQTDAEILIVDALTYAGHKANLKDVKGKWEFVHANICHTHQMTDLIQSFQPTVVINFAAESHVDRSISDPSQFVQTNVLGVLSLLNATLKYWQTLNVNQQKKFRFVQVSTDEVFGSLKNEGYFSEQTPYAPNSPYSASKAGGDHLARAWFHTYNLPTLITHCSNNYGPKQFPEKLIPHMLQCALAQKDLPVYGTGLNIRDWIHVSDHCQGIMLAVNKGRPGESYCFGGQNERTNLALVQSICKMLDQKRPRSDGKSYSDQIVHVQDRKGHDWRYAIDFTKAASELGYHPMFKEFESGLEKTIEWYLENSGWLKEISVQSARTI